MLRDISNDIVVNLKDRLRDVRHLIRASRQDAAPTPQELPEFVLDKVARVMDKAFTTAETVSISLISNDPAAHSTAIEARCLGAYFPVEASTGEALFGRDVYYLTKHILTVLGSHNALIHEASFTSVHAAMIRRHAILISAAKKGDPADIARACAVLAMELQMHSQTSPLLTPNTFSAAKSYLCFSAIALAIGLATYADNEPGGEKLVESALLALQARPEKIERARGANDNGRTLTDLFAFLIPHLP